MILNTVAAVLIGFGTLCCVISIIGIYRFDYVLTRMALFAFSLASFCSRDSDGEASRSF